MSIWIWLLIVAGGGLPVGMILWRLFCEDDDQDDDEHTELQ